MVFAGFGGQGVLFAGKVAAYAGLIEGKEISWLPSYGPEMRGGTANCSVCISDQPIPTVDGCLVTDRLPVHLINNTGKDALVLLIPHLERRNEAGGWEEVPYKEDVGFCGTPDPLPPEGKDWSEDLLYLWGTLEDGDYRLSYEVGDTFDTEDMAYGEFTLYTPEDNQGLPLSSGEVSQNGED